MADLEIDRLECELDRALLINLAYPLLGSMADAEDVAQETYVRWYRMTAAEREAVRTPAAWCVRGHPHLPGQPDLGETPS